MFRGLVDGVASILVRCCVGGSGVAICWAGIRFAQTAPGYSWHFLICPVSKRFPGGQNADGHSADALSASVQARCPPDAALSQPSRANATAADQPQVRGEGGCGC